MKSKLCLIMEIPLAYSILNAMVIYSSRDLQAILYGRAIAAGRTEISTARAALYVTFGKEISLVGTIRFELVLKKGGHLTSEILVILRRFLWYLPMNARVRTCIRQDSKAILVASRLFANAHNRLPQFYVNE